jgi:hypothetical protein
MELNSCFVVMWELQEPLQLMELHLRPDDDANVTKGHMMTQRHCLSC